MEAKVLGLNLDNAASQAVDIWTAGVQAVMPEASLGRYLSVEGESLTVGGPAPRVYNGKNVYLLAFGKAGWTMANTASTILSSFGGRIRGRVLVPFGNYAPLPSHLALHPVRAAGYNYPTDAVVQATAQVLADVSSLGDDDILLSLISGGGSALFEQPVEGLSVQHVVEVSKFLAGRQASIHELNRTRAALSQVKFGGLARRCTTVNMESLIVSDVMGDNLEIIASGPTLDTVVPSPSQALQILLQYGAGNFDVHRLVAETVAFLKVMETQKQPVPPEFSQVRHHLIATNRTAMESAILRARELGLATFHWEQPVVGDAYQFGFALAQRCTELQQQGFRGILVCGGETTVKLAPNRSPDCKGGRNQGIVLAAMTHLLTTLPAMQSKFRILSGGTDGEDGPTDAAGAIMTPELLAKFSRSPSVPGDYLQVNDEYGFFSLYGGLLQTGLTGTNVADLIVVHIDQ